MLDEKGGYGISSLIELSLQSPLESAHLPDKGFSDRFSASIAISVAFVPHLIHLIVIIFAFGLALLF
jgi:hypothetical protein